MSVSIRAEGLAAGVDAAIPTDFVCRFSVEQYHGMLRAGILGEDAPVELLDGWLVPKMMKNPSHSTVTALMRGVLEKAMPLGCHVRSQEPVTLAASEPEPDLVVVRGDLRDYLVRHPGPREVVLVVEVAEASLHRDQTTKKCLYAQAGIPCYWIVNLLENRVEVCGDPSGPGPEPDYHQRRDYGPSEEIPLVIDGSQIAALPVREMLP